MIKKVMPNNIPKVWDVIKFTTTTVDDVPDRHRQTFLNKLLHELLTDRFHCYVVINESNEIKIVAITRMIVDVITEEKKLLLQSFYSFERSTESEWKEFVDFFKQLAKKENCTEIEFTTKNPRIIQLGIDNDFIESRKYYSFKIGV